MGTWRAAFAVAAKELGEGFRDRQTVLYTFVLPVCMYPALFWLIVQGFLVVKGQEGAKDVRVAVSAPIEMIDAAKEAIRTPDATDGSEAASPAGAVAVDVIDVAPDAGVDELRELVRSDAENAPDAIVVLRAGAGAEEPVEVYFDSAESRSDVARRRVAQSLRVWAKELREQKAEARAVDPKALDPIVMDYRSLAEEKDQGALMLSLVLPMLLVVMCLMGAFFPAVDLTAGEKERGTAETTMLLPVPRTGVHLGKILAVCISAMIATSLNLAALALSAGHLLQQLGSAMAEAILVAVPVGAIVSVMPLAALYSFFVSAMLTGFASLASSFKEGQALLGPVQTLFILPGVAATLPGLELDTTTAWIPVVNVALAFRGMLLGNAPTVPVLLCALSLTLYAALAIWFAVRLRSNEQVALSGETFSLRQLAGLLRSTR